MLRKLRNGILYLLFLAISTLLLLEVCYRYYIVDFYSAQFQALNKQELEEAEDLPSILVVGDSFSADQNSYVKGLRTQISGHRIINAAIPGTCIRQHERFFAKRLKDFQPDLIIYQTYVGNDLLEYRHPTTGDGLSWQRKCYWWLADRFLVLGYINAQLPLLRNSFFATQRVDYDTKAQEGFSVENYSRRTPMLLRAEPSYLNNSILLKGARVMDMEHMSTDIAQMLGEVSAETPILVLVMPHCVQLGNPYKNRLEQLGADLDTIIDLEKEHYPYYQALERYLEAESPVLVNPLPWLKNSGRSDLYYPNDPHLTPAGQKLVSDSLLAIINPLIGQ